MNRQYILLAGLMIGLIGVLVWQLMPKEDPLVKTAQAPAATATPRPPAAGSPQAPAPGADEQALHEADMESLLTSVKEETFDYAENRIPRDPMIPLVGYINPDKQGDESAGIAVPPPRASLIRSKRVTGIVYDPSDPMAIVDNEVVYPGYTYPDGVVVESITERSVVFRLEESSITVELEER